MSSKLAHPVHAYLATLARQGQRLRWYCSHCNQEATAEQVYDGVAERLEQFRLVDGQARQTQPYPRFTLRVIICAACRQESLIVHKEVGEFVRDCGMDYKIVWTRQLYPVGRTPRSFPNTPGSHLKPYREACATLEISAAASACMSRRCLQGILSGQGYKQRDLAKQIESLLVDADPNRALPLELRQCVDAIRNYGNFGAHPVNDATTLQIIEVEAGEAEWCLEIAEQLMEHYFERPAIIKGKIAEANAKFIAAGKPGMKS